MRTAAASAMKLTASFLLLSAWCWAQSHPANEQPTSLSCTISASDPQRPERWQLFLTKTFPDGTTERQWASDHDSSSSAMKACEKKLAEQRKLWKQQIKDKGKKK